MFELLETTSALELAIWREYYAFDPFGYERGDLQAGTVAAAACNLWRGEGQKAISPVDFVPDFGGLEEEDEKQASGAAWSEWIEEVKRMKGGGNGNGNWASNGETDG